MTSKTLRAWRNELPAMFALAWPVALAELGWMAMGLVDTILVGRIGAEAIGAVSIGSHVYFTVGLFGIGMLLGLDYLVAHAFGAGRLEDARRALVHGAYLSVALAALLTPVLLIIDAHLTWFGIQPAVAEATHPYLRAVTWSLLPLLLYATLRRYAQALGHVRIIMVTLVSANVINAAVAWVLIFGSFGLPALGAEGAGWATCASRVYMFVVILAYVLRCEARAGRGWRLPLRFEIARFIEVVRLGTPAAFHLLLESGVFTAATLLAGRLTTDALAAHQIALSAASFTFMIPLGISSAAAVRVGHALGRRHPAAAARAGWTALALGVAAMSISATVFLTAPRAILAIFTDVPAVLASGVTLLSVAAAFQLFDGIQVVATGALRGLGDTRTAFLANLGGHWLFGLPIGAALCFSAGWGVVGLWIGLCIGLVAVAIALTAVWAQRSAGLGRG